MLWLLLLHIVREKDGDYARALLRNAAAFWQALASFPALGHVALGQGDAQELGPDGFCRGNH